jgi:hypothetical protein
VSDVISLDKERAQRHEREREFLRRVVDGVVPEWRMERLADQQRQRGANKCR